MKIINNNTKNGYRLEKMREFSKILDKFCSGYESNMLLCEGYIKALWDNKLINSQEKKWLTNIYVNCIETDDGLASRYSVNKRGYVEDWNEDTLECTCKIDPCVCWHDEK